MLSKDEIKQMAQDWLQGSENVIRVGQPQYDEFVAECFEAQAQAYKNDLPEMEVVF